MNVKDVVSIPNIYAIDDMTGVVVSIYEMVSKRGYSVMIQNVSVTPDEIQLIVEINNAENMKNFKNMCANKRLPENKNLRRIR